MTVLCKTPSRIAVMVSENISTVHELIALL